MRAVNLNSPPEQRIGEHPRAGVSSNTLGRVVGRRHAKHADGMSEAFIAGGPWELEIVSQRFPVRAQLAPPTIRSRCASAPKLPRQGFGHASAMSAGSTVTWRGCQPGAIARMAVRKSDDVMSSRCAT